MFELCVETGQLQLESILCPCALMCADAGQQVKAWQLHSMRIEVAFVLLSTNDGPVSLLSTKLGYFVAFNAT